MKHLKPFNESIDPKELQDYYQDLLDNYYEIIDQKEDWFLLEGKGSLEEVKQFLHMVEMEDVKCFWFIDTKDENKVKILCMDHNFYDKVDQWMTEFFKDVRHGVRKFSDKKHYIGFIKPGSKYYLAYQESKNGYFYCIYYGFWSVLESKFGLGYNAIQCFIKGWVDEAFKLEVGTPYKYQQY